ncbi:uncharacterized protein LOC108001038 isoform X3 [Apis cerana]|uniref:uncharacterized protein LOC108001038 isoform X3 n=1 Tax=Apis cerana TaxID=7461 RepID=UPI0007E2C1D0|nr:uncharacterized protein LOC108001038 isoform X3 [Apis cerana]
MMMAPQIVGVLLKKPGQQSHPRFPPLDPQETKIRGELYVEDLGERRIVSIRMGWLWVEGTPMRLPLRALNLRQAAPSLCQPHALALGFTLSNSQDQMLATFWADSEAIYWSWVRAIAAELVRQTPFRAQRCLNFLEILTICPRGPVPLPDSPTESRRRSRSELRCWPSDSPTEKNSRTATTILEESRRRARSELRGWSSSNSSDEDLLGDFRSIPAIISKEQPMSRTWGCSESSEGSDDSLPWSGVCRSSVDPAVSLPEPETREQRIQRYKEARRRENEARSRRVLEEDARRRKARAEENNNDILKTYGCSSRSRNRLYNSGNDNDNYCFASSRKENEEHGRLKNERNCHGGRLPPVKPNESPLVRFEEDHRTEDDKRNNNTTARNGSTSPGILRADTSERRSRARERRSVREKSGQLTQTQQFTNTAVLETLQERKERLAQLSSRIPVPRQLLHVSKSMESWNSNSNGVARTPSTSLSILTEPPCEEDVARLLERCQRVDHYVPVREKLTLFESLSRLGGRLARSTEDLGRTSSKPSPRGKQRARSLHDLNRGARAVPVREMCRFFEGDVEQDTSQKSSLAKTRFSDPVTPTRTAWKDPTANSRGNNEAAPCVRSSTRKKHYLK